MEDFILNELLALQNAVDTVEETTDEERAAMAAFTAELKNDFFSAIGETAKRDKN